MDISEGYRTKIINTISLNNEYSNSDSHVHNKRINVVTFLTCDFIDPFVHPRVYKEARSLIENGYNVTVICWCRSNKKFPKTEKYNGINVIRIFQKESFKSTTFFLRFLFYCNFIIKSLIISFNLKADIIHCNDLDTLIIGVMLKILIKKPLVFDSFEEYPLMWSAMHPNSKIMIFLLRLLEKYLIKFTDSVIIAEQLYADNIEKKYKIIPHLICNFPDLKYFNQSLDGFSIIEKFKLKHNIIISTIGGIGDNRATFELLEAVKYVNCEKVKFVFIGKSTPILTKRILSKINALNIEDKVILILDGIKYEDIPKYYKVSDISMALLYPIPTYITSVPTKFYESLAVGVPVIAADTPPIKEIINKYQVGLYVNSKDVKDISSKLNYLIKNKQLRQSMGNNGIIVAQQRFNWSISENELLKVYEELK